MTLPWNIKQHGATLSVGLGRKKQGHSEVLRRILKQCRAAGVDNDLHLRHFNAFSERFPDYGPLMKLHAGKSCHLPPFQYDSFHENTMHKKLHRNRSRKAGFSLLEILIAVALMALLASVAISQLIGVFGENQVTAAEIFINDSKLPLTRYRLDVGNFPSTEEGLRALLTPPAGKEARWKGPYVTEEPIDPWGNPYQYRFPGTKNVSGARGYDIWSLGEDGTESADDITNWKK